MPHFRYLPGMGASGVDGWSSTTVSPAAEDSGTDVAPGAPAAGMPSVRSPVSLPASPADPLAASSCTSLAASAAASLAVSSMMTLGSPGLRGVRIAELSPLAGLLDYEDTRLKTSSRVREGLSLAWKASLVIRICRSPTIVTDSM